jgi:hypothetical protein
MGAGAQSANYSWKRRAMSIERKVTGLENLVMQVEEAKSALKILEREIESTGGGQEIERLIDERMAEFRSNAIVMTLVQDLKAKMRGKKA